MWLLIGVLFLVVYIIVLLVCFGEIEIKGIVFNQLFIQVVKEVVIMVNFDVWLSKDDLDNYYLEIDYKEIFQYFLVIFYIGLKEDGKIDVY